MFVPRAALNHRHPATAIYAQGTDQKRQMMAEEEARAGARASFRVFGYPLETLTSFEYLECQIIAT